jgi:hypothetical protein
MRFCLVASRKVVLIGWKRIVTTPPEIIPYYRLNHSISSLSDNKEASC